MLMIPGNPQIPRCTAIRVLSLAFLLLLSTPSLAADITRETLFALINERLSYMEQVALFKFHNKVAVEDLEREQQVVEDSRRSAAQLGLDPEVIATFFEAQIAVAKAVQYRYLADWLSAPSTEPPPDLANQIRPRLTELGEHIVETLAELWQSGDSIGEAHRRAFHAAITVEHVSEDDKDLLFDSLVRNGR